MKKRHLPLIVLFLFLLGGWGLFAVKRAVEARVSLPALEAQLSAMTGMTVKAQRSKATLSGRLFLDHVTVTDRRSVGRDRQDAASVEATDKTVPLLSVERVVVGIRLWDLIGGKVSVEELALNEPTLTASKSQLVELATRFRPTITPTKAIRIILQDGRLLYQASPSVRLSLKDLNGSIRSQGNVAEGKLEARGEGERGEVYSLKGKWASAGSHLTLEAREIPLSLWKKLLSPDNPTAIDGKGTILFTATGIFPDMTLEGTVQLKESAINGYPIKELKSEFKTTPKEFRFAPFTLAVGGGTLEGEAAGSWPRGGYRHYDISAKGSMKGIALDKLSLPDLPMPVEGILEGDLTLESRGGRAALGGTLRIPKGAFKEGPSFSSLSAHFTSSEGAFRLDRGDLIIFGGPVAFKGELRRNGRVSLAFKGGALDLSKEPWFRANQLEVAPGGHLEGVMAGRLQELELRGNIGGLNVSRKTRRGVREWKGVALRTAVSIRDKEIAVHQFLLSANNRQLPLTGRVTWVPTQSLTIEARSIPLDPLVAFLGAPAGWGASHGAVHGRITIRKEPAQVEGRIEGTGGTLVGERFDTLWIAFQGDPGKAVPYSGELHRQGKMVSFQGTVDKENASITLQGKQFPIRELPGVGGRFPDLGGNVTFTASFATDSPNDHRIQFSLPNGRYRGRPLPAMEGTLHWQENVVKLFPLSFSGLRPPLTVSGSIEPARQAISLAAEFNGQSLKALSGFLPGSASLPTGPVDAKLHGKLKVGGSFSRPELSFTGKADDIDWNGIPFGSGSLSLAGTPPDKLVLSFHARGVKLAGLAKGSRFLPPMEGTASLDLEHRGSTALIQVATRDARLQGKSLPPMAGTFHWKPPLLGIEKLELSMVAPPLVLSGALNLETRHLDIAGSLNGQGMAQIAALAGPALGSAAKPALPDGRLYGNVKLFGTLPRPAITFQGRGEGLKMGDLTLGSGALSISLHPQADTYRARFAVENLDVQNLEVLAKQLPGLRGRLALEAEMGAQKGEATAIAFTLSNPAIDGRPLPAMSGTLVWQPPVARLPSLRLATTPPIAGSAEINTGSKAFTFQASLAGQSVGELGKLAGIPLSGMDARLHGPLAISASAGQLQIHFSGKGTNFLFQDLALGSGQLDITAAATLPESGGQPAAQVQIKADQIPAQQVSLLQAQYPGLTGQVRFQMSYHTQNRSQAQITFGLSGASRRGTAFPSVAATIQWQAPGIRFAPLRLTDTNPPLDLVGSVNTQSKQMVLDAQLSGQSLATLMKLSGSTTTEIDGRLHGPLAIRGTSAEPAILFQGKLSHLLYRGTELGSGDLVLSATSQALDGKLVLHSLSAPVAILGQLFGLSPSRVRPVIYIKGTPKDPKISLATEPRRDTGVPQPRVPDGSRPPTGTGPLPSGGEILQDILEGIFKPKKK